MSKPKVTKKTATKKAWCLFCKRTIRVTKDGLFALHRWQSHTAAHYLPGRERATVGLRFRSQKAP